ncbi:MULTISPECIES: phosphoglycolate phosphatase [Caballeronia]|jgi:phosphoglycolate phosphatase|uniref:Phosphoglycolate phosphatase n=1 Tax=Caballeronia zhejiangensis TaxID=871203 RepID=A0A656QAK9_9BURK|nr:MULTISPECIES: phosphoglycolate phosphatase [Caballeronia]EKS72171.1 phosphoglycolate phosphatase [Burkholderia sp. SJ98]KDR25752.1 phosphoglycolate phosphatase [Caballeronia zhejiangensis]MCG7405176.1 phosphoglycolate phosphatase [Caballeronia zhejiangensis]MCI1047313.1 phosphoglycolate phosphatase [Caballeronia zhejiangensis]MDR5786383.1 phosphoglycolate phosphatase [Caballeronia sp. LP003]
MSEIAAAQSPFVNRPIRAAIIDLDGTMVDTADDFVAALNAMLARIAIEQPVTRDEVTGYVGKGSENLIRSVLAVRLSPSQAVAQFDDALAIYQSEYAKVNGKHSTLFPEVREGLEAMRESGVALACVTNKPHRFAVELLAHFGIADFFKVILGGDSLPAKKPDPLPMLTACERLDVLPRETVAVGDSENDALAGRAAGLATLTVPYGYNHGKPVQSVKSDGIVSSLRTAASAIAATLAPPDTTLTE